MITLLRLCCDLCIPHAPRDIPIFRLPTPHGISSASPVTSASSGHPVSSCPFRLSPFGRHFSCPVRRVPPSFAPPAFASVFPVCPSFALASPFLLDAPHVSLQTSRRPVAAARQSLPGRAPRPPISPVHYATPSDPILHLIRPIPPPIRALGWPCRLLCRPFFAHSPLPPYTRCFCFT